MIQENVHKEFNKNYTFSPVTYADKSATGKRNFEQFIDDQQNYKIKTNEKIRLLKEEKSKKNLLSDPKIDEVIIYLT